MRWRWRSINVDHNLGLIPTPRQDTVVCGTYQQCGGNSLMKSNNRIIMNRVAAKELAVCVVVCS